MLSTHQPLIYAGRFADQITGRNVLSEWDALPRTLLDLITPAPLVVILDAFSFPFEILTDEHWDIPLVVTLPQDFEADQLEVIFGSVVFQHLGFFDRLVVADTALWRNLQQRYRWAESQRLPIEKNNLHTILASSCSQFDGAALPQVPDISEHDTIPPRWKHRRETRKLTEEEESYWSLRIDKSSHRSEAAALLPQFAEARGQRPVNLPLNVLEVGTAVGRWAASFHPETTRFVGLDVNEEMLRQAQNNFPWYRFDKIPSDLRFPYQDESFDLVFSSSFLPYHPTPLKQALLAEMWRVTAPGGRLLFLENFIATPRTNSSPYPMSVSQFIELLLDATCGQVVLEHVESIRYRGDDMHRAGVITVSKIGVPKTW